MILPVKMQCYNVMNSGFSLYVSILLVKLISSEFNPSTYRSFEVILLDLHLKIKINLELTSERDKLSPNISTGNAPKNCDVLTLKVSHLDCNKQTTKTFIQTDTRTTKENPKNK